MYAAIPISITFRLNENKHSVATAKNWKEPTRQISSSVKAVFGNNYEEAEALLISDVTRYVAGFWEVVDKKIEVKDFSVFYSMEPVKEGRFWASHSCGTSQQLK